MSNNNNSPSLTRKQAALRSIVRRKSSLAPERPPVDLAYLVRVYLLDGSSKVLQMKESSTTKEVLEQLKYNMDLCSIKTFALFRVCGLQMRRLELSEKIRDAMTLLEGETDVKILFRSWICDEAGSFEKSALQEGIREKQPNTALWLKYIEAIFMVASGKYYLTEDESIMLGCLKLQADSGDYRPSIHTTEILQTRIATSFPSPIKEKMCALLTISEKNKKSKNHNKLDKGEEFTIVERVKLLYSRLSGYTKSEAQIEYIRYLRVWCPFYNSTFYAIECQYDDKPYDTSNQPPVLQVNIAISPLAIFIITLSHPPVILRLPYNRIVKYVSHADMNIFMFWSLKDSVQLSDIEKNIPKKNNQLKEEGEENDDDDNDDDNREREREVNEEEQNNQQEDDLGFDPNQYCDCIYFVTDYVKEIQFLFETYFKMLKFHIPPCLPGDVLDDDNGEDDFSQFGSFDDSNNENNQKQNTKSQNNLQNDIKRQNIERRSSRLNLFFQALGVNSEEQSLSSSTTTAGGGGGVTSNLLVQANLTNENDVNQVYSDDAAQINTSIFTNLYSQQTSKTTSKTIDGNGNVGSNYDGIDMLLANSLNELNELSQIENKKVVTFKDNEEIEENNNNNNNNNDSNNENGNTKRKSIFRWGSSK